MVRREVKVAVDLVMEETEAAHTRLRQRHRTALDRASREADELRAKVEELTAANANLLGDAASLRGQVAQLQEAAERDDTEREEFTRTVRLLGQRVQLRITPAQFNWHFDDGESTTTATPGAPYPKLEITHDYLEKGDVRPRVDTTYTADFRVNGGGWQPVPGSVTIPGESVAVEVVEASPILVGYQ